MSYPTSYVFIASAAGLTATLRAQYFDADSADVGTALDTGFSYIGAGEGSSYYYQYDADIPDSHRGGIKIYDTGAPSVILMVAAINPNELENADAKVSLTATQTSVNTIDDLLDTEIAAITASLAALTTKIAAIRAGVVGRSVADDANDPTEIIYYDEDDTTPLFTHTLTDTERAVA